MSKYCATLTMHWTRRIYPFVAIARQQPNRCLSTATYTYARFARTHALCGTRNFVTDLRPITVPATTTPIPTIRTTPSAVPPKKRPGKPKPHTSGFYNAVAYATAEEYDLERLRASLLKEGLYQLHDLPQPATDARLDGAQPPPEDTDYLYATARHRIDDEPREIFFFRAGSVVLWNCSELECSNVLAQLKHCELDSYDRRLVAEERDCMAYDYDEQRARLANGNFRVSRGADAPLEKYTFSNALSTSVKLGIWEASLARYVDSMAYVTADLKRGAKIRMSRAEVLRKTGELFALRHMINLSSDLLDTPDFYWDREQLEGLYSAACGHFSVQRRTKVSVCGLRACKLRN